MKSALPIIGNYLNVAKHLQHADLVRDLQQMLHVLQKTLSDAIQATVTQGLAANLPPAGTSGRFFYATDTVKLYYDDGTQWNLLN